MFDTHQSLINKIRLGEDALLELKNLRFKGKKIVGPSRDELANELAAFANANGGVLVIGVDDKTRDISGIPLEKLDDVETYVRQICTDALNPPLFAHIVRMELPDADCRMQSILKIDIPKSLFVHEGPGGYFQRLGSSKRKMPPEVLARLFQQKSQARLIRFDEQAVPGTNRSTLAEYLWRRFVPPEEADPILALKKMRILVEDDNGDERASVAGVLLCSDNPENIMPNAYIEAVRYRGNERDSDCQATAARIVGPLDRQVQHALSFVRVNMRVAAVKRPGRVEFPQFSLRAVFEALVNAVAHRDYSIHVSKIRLFIYDDRLELFSPGPPPNTVTPENLHLRQATRNELIASLLSRCPTNLYELDFSRQFFMEKRGEGVPIIIRESLGLSGKPPVYNLIDDTELLLTIPSGRMPPED